jgi:hypothetical protein
LLFQGLPIFDLFGRKPLFPGRTHPGPQLPALTNQLLRTRTPTSITCKTTQEEARRSHKERRAHGRGETHQPQPSTQRHVQREGHTPERATRAKHLRRSQPTSPWKEHPADSSTKGTYTRKPSRHERAHHPQTEDRQTNASKTNAPHRGRTTRPTDAPLPTSSIDANGRPPPYEQDADLPLPQNKPNLIPPSRPSPPTGKPPSSIKRTHETKRPKPNHTSDTSPKPRGLSVGGPSVRRTFVISGPISLSES